MSAKCSQAVSKLRPRAPETMRRNSESVFCFSVLANAEPGVMPRVLGLLAKRNLVPHRWHSDRVGPEGQRLAIDFQVVGLGPELSDYMARCLEQLHDVDSVLTSEKPLL